MDNRKVYTEEEMESIRASGTSGFYKVDPDGVTLLFGRFYVLNADYELHRHLKDTYSYPVDGWSWFESEEAARQALNCPVPKTEEEQAEELLAALTPEQLALIRDRLNT